MDKGAKRKLRLALLALGLVLYVGFKIYLLYNIPPEANARMTSFMRDSPAWQFYGLMGLISIPFLLIAYILVNQRRWSRMATGASVHSAKKVATSLWYVDGTMAEMEEQLKQAGKLLKVDDDDEGFAVVRFRHVSFGNWKFTLPVRPGHPDIDKFRQLKTGDRVEFEPLPAGMECALDHELCGFLRIKSVS